MASMQCQRPTNETCQQKCHKPSSNQQQQSSSLSQKVSQMTDFLKGGAHHRTHAQPPQTTITTHTTRYTETITHKNPQHHHGSGGPKHQLASGTNATTNHVVIGCNGKTKKKNTKKGDQHMKEKDSRNVFQKIKDKIFDDSSCSDSSSETLVTVTTKAATTRYILTFLNAKHSDTQVK